MDTSTAEFARIEALHAEVVLRTFAGEARIGHHLSYVRTLASPTVAALLAHTGHMEHDSVRRATDTGLFMYEMITHGLDHPRSRFLVGRLNELHGRWNISQQDYRWVLGTFVFMPCRAIDSFGWRPLRAVERAAIVAWYHELGRRMGIHDLPESYEAWSQDFDDYEAIHLRPSTAGLRLMDATWNVVLAPLPRRLRPLGRRAAACLISEPARGALGITSPSSAMRLLVAGVLRAKGLATRLSGPPRTPWFIPGAPLGAHREGYEIQELGPHQPIHPNAESAR